VGSSQNGGDIRVMLANSFHAMVAQIVDSTPGAHHGYDLRDVCPRCQSSTYKKNSHIHHGKQNHQGKDCGRQFVDGFEQYLVSDETRELIERLLWERLSPRGICRAVGVGLK
jgi:hypothetical protein